MFSITLLVTILQDRRLCITAEELVSYTGIDFLGGNLNCRCLFMKFINRENCKLNDSKCVGSFLFLPLWDIYTFSITLLENTHTLIKRSGLGVQWHVSNKCWNRYSEWSFLVYKRKMRVASRSRLIIDKKRSKVIYIGYMFKK